MNLVDMFKRCYMRAQSRGLTWIPVTEHTLPAEDVFEAKAWVLVVDLIPDRKELPSGRVATRQYAPYVRRARVATLRGAWKAHRMDGVPMQFSHWAPVPALPDYGLPDALPYGDGTSDRARGINEHFNRLAASLR